ncbi:phage major capsid protein [Micromonospora globbae]|uniref:phage major capsid protein n=1 Tax=Micromonospora globbae TaxID=1894969 RepID=UPI0034202BB1
MSTKMYDRLRADHGNLLRELKSLADKATAENRELTDDEREQALSLKAQADGVKHRMEQIRADEKLSKALAGIGVGGEGGPRFNDGSPSEYVPTGAGSKWARQVAGKLIAQADRHGVKALTSGSIEVPAVVEPIVALPARPLRVLDLIPRRTLTENTYEYLRQTVRTNNAAPVADGAVKPTSIYTVVSVEDRARVFAHLSEPIPERYFADHAELVQLIDTEMREDALLALEAQMVSGDGTGENLTGILNVSGTLSVPFATDALTTIRKARTQLEAVNEQPTAWVFNPADLEAFDLLREDGATGGYLVNSSSLNNIFGPYPRVSSTTVPAGTAILGDWTKARLRVREDMRLDVDRSGENFTKNLATLRVEGRFGFDITRPSAFAEVDLAA